jgi:hypothetical protein
MSQLTEANVSCSSLSALATYKHANAALSSTCFQSIGGGEKPGEPGRSNPDTPRPIVPKDLRVGVESLRTILLGAPMSVPHITKS